MPQPESFVKCICQHCGGRIQFPASGAGREIPCPHCKWPTTLTLIQPTEAEKGGGRRGRKQIYAGTAIVAGVVLAAGAYYYFGVNKQDQTGPILGHLSNSSPVVVTQAPPAKPIPPLDPWHGLHASEVSLEKAENGDLVFAVGRLTNSATRQRFGVKVQLDVLDRHSHKIGVATDYTEVIDPGKEWKFRAMVTDKSAKAARLVSVKEE